MHDTIDDLANDYVAKLCELSPLFASETGLKDTGDLDDFSPEGAQAHADLRRKALAELEALRPRGDSETVTKAAMIERLTAEQALHEAGEDIGVINPISSPIQAIRDSFDLMDTSCEEGWQLIEQRVAQIPQALASYRRAIAHRVACGPQIPARQVARLRAEIAAITHPTGTLDDLAARREGLDVAKAKQAFAELSDVLAEVPTTTVDGVGPERYPAHLAYFLGAEVDIDETFVWAEEELARVIAEQEETVGKLYGPGVTVREAMDRLNRDPKRMIHGTDALREWMQETADDAMSGMLEHFDIPQRLQTIEAMVITPGTGGIYYTGPSQDFSRPGRMWWSVPEGVEHFNTWLEKTTVYHEGVPGHHLQIGLAIHLADQLNDWRRFACFVSGHAEGWALYAERLMAELGYLEDPGDYLGMLDSQRLRITRVLVDIGAHTRGWSYEQAWQMLTENVAMDRNFLRFELDRYLGWPGQSPSYKIGQRLWENERTEALGRGESLREFHARALSLGTLGLDVLHEALSR
ncbi:MAG: DUF885 domain-containing protein [Flaviflexus sp.]|nr:DUF885 domain-containing protein [Flaviflexus sp.]